MVPDRCWLALGAAGALGAALAAGYWVGWLEGVPWRRPPPAGWQPCLRHAASCGGTLLLLGLPAAGRTALMVRALLNRPGAVAVPREVTDRPPCGRADPAATLYQYVSAAELRRRLQLGSCAELRQRDGYRFAAPLRSSDGDGPQQRPAPLCLLKASLTCLPHLPSAESGARPLLVYVRVSQRERLLARLMLRDGLSRRSAETLLRASERRLDAALLAAGQGCLFDAVVDNDDLDDAAVALQALIDAQLGTEPAMRSARQRLNDPAAEPATEPG